MFFDLSNTTRVEHQMWACSQTSHFLHITKEVAQATIDTGVIGETIPAVTLCNKTFTAGDAVDFMHRHSHKVCKGCAKKAGI
jgi:hypothetical protein